MEPVVGTNGILIPPEGYMQGVREICDRHGILLIADEVMSGSAAPALVFSVDHWNVVPDILTMAKGITSAYVPLGAVGLRPQVARVFQDRAFPGGLTYNSHPLRARRRWPPSLSMRTKTLSPGPHGWVRSCAGGRRN